MVRALNWDVISFRAVFGLIAAITVFVLIFPTVVILMLSFTSDEALRFPPSGYSFRWYLALLDANEIQDAAWLSFKVAVMATGLSCILAVSAALGVYRSDKAWARAAETLFLSPLILPALAFGFAALMMFSMLGIRPSMLTLTIGHVVVSVPFIMRTTLASLSQLDPALLDCSKSLGAGEAYTFRKITLPLIAPGVASGAFIAFMASFDNVPVSLFLQDTRTQVLPIHLWDIIQNQLDSRAASACGVIIIMTVVMMVLMERVAGFSRFMK
ncbi:Inner membrane ABC transporter permease protein YdcV [Hartmannibacter diazotrophicus]|uniref:Inner membrane ABC transporter permease protein YdcV n=1 Tax=Hartmannibacter diazotrophicus TaxID=1482074 RepID=A0A2C9D9A6_9HYPH|nr:ABC transporter permease [Hartmannibacter diazotrophicus]SON56750.1 Inner membrane ABC transporter permease protein YdcV [Hartmannibacter diazotrophicus]